LAAAFFRIKSSESSSGTSHMPEAIGIIAGAGQFPALVAKGATQNGFLPVIAGFSGHTDPDLEECAHAFSLLHIGQVGKLIKYFRTQGIRKLCFAGAIDKPRALDMRPDFIAARLLLTMKSKGDDSLLRSVIDYLGKEGFEVVSAADFTPQLRAPAGVLTKKPPSDEMWQDIRYAWPIARSMGHFDIGQCLVIKKNMVIGVECIEGTDAVLRRSGELGGKNCVAVKMVKPGQDERIDLPSVGLETVRILEQYGYACLAVEAGKTLFFDQQEAIKLANAKKIVIVALNEKGEPGC
jgi:DUF1009 family protein